MGIELGLGRVEKLLKLLANPHRQLKCIHVTGTNGKGSTLAYLSSILSEANIRHGRFTTPHTILVNDSLSINRDALPMEKFQQYKMKVQAQNDRHEVGCTEFEILTCSMFLAFAFEAVELALIEVGLGGRNDATNVVSKDEVLVSGITKIGIDHEKFLGNTISLIAHEKAGIIKNGIDCVVDLTNSEEALEVIRKQADQQGSPLHEVNGSSSRIQRLIKLSPLRGKYQEQNLAISLKIVSLLRDKYQYNISDEAIERGIQKTTWPGRLQLVQHPEKNIQFLLDGAHNESAAIELGKYLEDVRKNNEGIIFVVALTKGKSIEGLLKHIVKNEHDSVIPMKFLQPEDMPWVHCYDASELAQVAKKFVNNVDDIKLEDANELFEHLQKLKNDMDNRQVVICGSLYLCADILRAIQYAPHQR